MNCTSRIRIRKLDVDNRKLPESSTTFLRRSSVREIEFCRSRKTGICIMTMHRLIRLVGDFLAKHGIPRVPQSLCSPDSFPSDFWLLPEIKQHGRIIVLRVERSSGKMRHRNWGLSWKKDSGSRRFASQNVWTLREPIFKGLWFSLIHTFIRSSYCNEWNT